VRILIIREIGVKLDNELISRALKEKVVNNSYPEPGGIAVFECGTEPNWKWPDTTIVVGQCDIQRNRADMSISANENIESELIDAISLMEDSDNEESAVGVAS
jgi:hypothetical protein